MKIIFSGGGTLGPVTPLLAIHNIVKKEHKDATFLWVGTKKGPEQQLVTTANIPFISIASGKFRRYLSLKNILDIFKLKIGFLQSCKIMWKENPDLCISAGGFVSVPLHMAAWVFGVPTWIHQQDVDTGLANKVMTPFASKITTALEQNVVKFPKKKTTWLGNPVRRDILSGTKKQAQKLFKLDSNLPVLFATGGGTGSLRVNQLIVQASQHLEGVCQIIHLSGKDRPQELVNNANKHLDYYQVHQFFTNEMKQAYAAADIIISRGGFGTITEIAALGKPAILIPKPGHQEDNVQLLQKTKAVILVNEETADGNYLAKIIKELLADTTKRKHMGNTLNQILPIAKKDDILDIITTLTA